MAAPKELMIYEYAVVLQAKTDKEGDTVEEGKIIVEPTTVLSVSEEQVQMLAARAIPEEYIGELDRITVAVRPF